MKWKIAIATFLLVIPMWAKASTDFSMPPVMPVTMDGVTYTGYAAWHNSSNACYLLLFNSASTYNGGDYSHQGSGSMSPPLIAGYFSAATQWGLGVSGTGARQFHSSSTCSPSAVNVQSTWHGMIEDGANFAVWIAGNDVDWFSSNTDVISGFDSSVFIYNTATSTTYYTYPISTSFISVEPTYGTTTATTSSVGAVVYANPKDFDTKYGGRLHMHFVQDSSFACLQAVNVGDIFTCTGSNRPAAPFDVYLATTTTARILAGRYDLFQDVTFPSGGAWTGTYEIQRISEPWYYLTLVTSYDTIVSTTTHFTIGTSSPMDIVRGQIQAAGAAQASTTRNGIGRILASTTAAFGAACNPLSGNFNAGDCITLAVWPGDAAFAEDYLIITQTPPWGYVFRMIDILRAPVATSSLPQISYTFASTSPFASIGEIHFDPFAEIAAAGSLINEMHSDRPDSANIWTILMPIVKIFVYMFLGFMIIHDLTGIHRGHTEHKENKEK